MAVMLNVALFSIYPPVRYINFRFAMNSVGNKATTKLLREKKGVVRSTAVLIMPTRQISLVKTVIKQRS